MVLEVKVREPVKSALERTLTFSQSPVRIGRNQLNDVHLDDPFVSAYHGIVRFDDAGMAYFDLGSTNGTMMAGQRVTKNVPVSLSDASRISIGRIDLTFWQRRKESGPPRTMGLWQQTPAGGPRPHEPAPQAGGSNPELALPARDAHAPAEVSSRAPMASAPLDTPSGRPTADVSAGVAARRDKIIQALAEAFVGLKNGYEQFGSEVGVRTISGVTPLHKARTSREVLDYLLSPGVDASTAIQELISIFADFGIHHIAMMEGVTEGARAVVQSLDPRANGLDGSPGLLSKARHKELWKSYLERFDQVVSDDNELHAGIFGDDFARAYAGVTTGDKGGGPAGKGR